MAKLPPKPPPSYTLNKPIKNKATICDREIRFKCSLQNTIQDVLRARPGWVEVIGEGEWDFYWCDREWLKENYDSMYLQEHQKILHFRNHYELTRKNLMVKNLKRMKKQVEREQSKIEAKEFDFYPTTYELPSEYHIFVEEFKKNPGLVWIMKPAARAQGRGIFLFRKLKDITDWRKVSMVTRFSFSFYHEAGRTSAGMVDFLFRKLKNITDWWKVYMSEARGQGDQNPVIPETYVVQRYLENPYLIGGRKFDIRVYALVTSFMPLKVWLYRGGFARFSNTRFSLDSIEDAYVHLTNVAIQKTAPDYDPEKGCKWSTQQLRQYLTAKHGIPKVKEVFKLLDDIIIKSLQSVSKLIINDKHCFEMYGYDILLDANLRPWLIEINASPSLTASGKEDYDLKFGLLNDVLNVIDVESRLTGKEKRIGGFDLIWDDGQVLADDSNMFVDGVNPFDSVTNSFLGCCNDRLEQLREIDQISQVVKRVL